MREALNRIIWTNKFQLGRQFSGQRGAGTHDQGVEVGWLGWDWTCTLAPSPLAHQEEHRSILRVSDPLTKTAEQRMHREELSGRKKETPKASLPKTGASDGE